YFERYDRHHGQATTFTDFDANAFKSFWGWQDEVYKGKIELPPQGKGRGRTNPDGFSPDSLRKYQKAFYVIADYAEHLGITLGLKNTRYERKLLVALPDAPAAKKYLNTDDIKAVIDYMPTTPSEAMAREYLIVGCLTGQRFQTMQSLHALKPIK